MHLLTVSAIAACLFLGQPPETIVIDGQFDDWESTGPSLVDPADAPHACADFGEVRVKSDERFVHLLIDFGKVINVQGLDGAAMILLDADGDPKTGVADHGMPGVDVVIDLTPPNAKTPGKPGMGIGLRSTTYKPDPNDPKAHKIIPYDAGITFAPTHAGRRMEFRIERGASLPRTPPLFENKQFSAKLVLLALDGAVADETDIFTHRFSDPAKPQQTVADQPSDPLDRSSNDAVRVLSWNAEVGAIFTRSDPFARTFAAVRPDVILLQELTSKNSAEQLQAFLTTALPAADDSPWHVLFGSGGGDLRCAIATRATLSPSEPLTVVSMPEHPDRTIRVIGGTIGINGKRLLAVSVHLKCCGRAGGPEDQQRQEEAHAIHDAIKAASSSQSIDGIIIAGDFNLVGSRDPVEIMAAGLDLDGSTMDIADPHQLDGLSNATWSDPKQPFVPGRLDYFLFSGSHVQVTRSFVYDSRDLGARWLQQHHVQREDSTAASDHFPVVVELGWLPTR